MEKGFSVYVAFGEWGGLGLHNDGPAIRLNLGFASFCICFFNIERTCEILLMERDEDG